MQLVSAAAVVVNEKNGQLSAAVRREMTGRTAVTIVAQSAGEHPCAFAMRVNQRARKQGEQLARPDYAVLCCGTALDAASWNARTAIAESLLSSIADGGDLVIAADRQSGSDSLERYLSLVDGLRVRSSATNKKVRLQFDTLQPTAPRRHGRRAEERRDWRMTG